MLNQAGVLTRAESLTKTCQISRFTIFSSHSSFSYERKNSNIITFNLHYQVIILSWDSKGSKYDFCAVKLNKYTTEKSMFKDSSKVFSAIFNYACKYIQTLSLCKASLIFLKTMNQMIFTTTTNNLQITALKR